MDRELLPDYVTPRIAAALSGRSHRAIRRLLAAGTLANHGTPGRAAVPIEEVARILGREISPEDYLEADREQDAYRRSQRAYNATRTKP